MHRPPGGDPKRGREQVPIRKYMMEETGVWSVSNCNTVRPEEKM